MTANPRCYASPLGHCSTKISREHYISEALLNEIGSDLEVSGTAFTSRGPKILPPSALTVRVLCTTHNSALSALDTMAADVFRTIRRFGQELANPLQHRVHETYSIKGRELERWLVKVYCGAHFGGVFANGGQKLTANSFELYLLENVFNSAPLPKRLGLYFKAQLGERMTTFKGVGFAPASIPITGQVVAMEVLIYGFRFYVSVRPATSEGSGVIDGGQRHPIGIELRSGDRARLISFDWS